MRKTYNSYERLKFTGTLKQANVLTMLNALYPFKPVSTVHDVLDDRKFKKVKFMIHDYMNSEELKSELVNIGVDNHDIKKIVGIGSEYLSSLSYLYAKSMTQGQPIDFKLRTRHKIKADIKAGMSNKDIADKYGYTTQYISEIRIQYEYAILEDVYNAVKRHESMDTICSAYAVRQRFVMDVQHIDHIKEDIEAGMTKESIMKKYLISAPFYHRVVKFLNV